MIVPAVGADLDVVTAEANEVGISIVFEPNDSIRRYRKRDDEYGKKE